MERIIFKDGIREEISLMIALAVGRKLEGKETKGYVQLAK